MVTMTSTLELSNTKLSPYDIEDIILDLAPCIPVNTIGSKSGHYVLAGTPANSLRFYISNSNKYVITMSMAGSIIVKDMVIYSTKGYDPIKHMDMNGFISWIKIFMKNIMDVSCVDIDIKVHMAILKILKKSGPYKMIGYNENTLDVIYVNNNKPYRIICERDVNTDIHITPYRHAGHDPIFMESLISNIRKHSDELCNLRHNWVLPRLIG